MEIADAVYRLTANYPRDEIYGMTSQTRRAAISIAANIAEGYGRDSKASFVQFLKIAQGSLKELETHLLLAARVGIAACENVETPLQRCDNLGRMLRSLIRTVQRKQADD